MKKKAKPVTGFLFNKAEFKYPHGKLFMDKDEYSAALVSGEWSYDMNEPTKTEEDEGTEKTEDEKYVSQMNKTQLIEHALVLGIQLDPELSNSEMREIINKKEE